MTRDEHLLAIAAEECNELAQRLIKAQRFGINQVQPPSHTEGTTDTSTNPEQLDNRERIRREYSHLVNSMRMLGIDYDVLQVEAKFTKVERYLQYCAEYGTLTDTVCKHGVAMDVHCCGCHTGFLFNPENCICLHPSTQ